MNFIHKRLFGLSEPTDPLRKASSEQLDKETVTAQTTFPFSRFHLKRRKVKRTHQTEPADIRCTSTGTSFLSGATNVNINTTNIFLQSGRPVSVDPATFNFNHTETHNSSISTICRIAKTTEEITTKLDHVITLFDRIDGPYDLERSTPNETMGYNHAVLEESRMQVMDMAVMSPTSPVNMLVEMLDKLKDLQMSADVVESTSNYHLGWSDLQEINRMLVSGFIFQLDVAVSERLPYLNHTLDRVGVTLMARLLQDQTQEEQARRWQAEEQKFQKEIEELQIEKRRVERWLQEKELQLQHLRENMINRHSEVSILNAATDVHFDGSSINVNVVNYIIESHS